MPHETHPTRIDWDALAEDVATLVASDDPRLGSTVAAVEAVVGCSLGTPDRSPVVLGRRFARAHALGLARGVTPTSDALQAAA